MYPTSNVEQWDIDDVSAVLMDLGLDALVPEFRTNAIDGKFLKCLTDDDLSEQLHMKPLQIKKLRMAMERASGCAAVNSSHKMTTAAGVHGVDTSSTNTAAVANCTTHSQTHAAQAAHLLAAADQQLSQAAELLNKAAATQVVQTGVRAATSGTLFRRGFSPSNVAANIGKKRQVDSAHQATMSAVANIQQAALLVPDLPQVQHPRLAQITGAMVQGLVDNVVFDAMRISKIQASKRAVDETRQQVAVARGFLAHAMTPGGLGPPPVNSQNPIIQGQAAVSLPAPAQSGASPLPGQAYAPPVIMSVAPPVGYPQAPPVTMTAAPLQPRTGPSPASTFAVGMMAGAMASRNRRRRC